MSREQQGLVASRVEPPTEDAHVVGRTTGVQTRDYPKDADTPRRAAADHRTRHSIEHDRLESMETAADHRTESANGEDLTALLICVACGHPLQQEAEEFECRTCGTQYPIVDGTVRMVRLGEVADVRAKTAESFAYEWGRFGELRPEWRKNFEDYLRPIEPSWLKGKRVLDVGTGSGRHAREAAERGAEVVAVDLGEAIEVARRNLPPEVLTVQADAEQLPFEPDSFDMVMSIGVLHHLPDPAAALRSIARYVRPGGFLHVYLYWRPPYRWHRAVLGLVSAVRRGTVRLPHGLLLGLCYPLAAALHLLVVLPYRTLRHRDTFRSLAEALPLKTYADYPFGVLVNDQFDRLSAPIEHRYEAAEVEAMLVAAGLEEVQVVANHGWIGHGRRPVRAQSR